jgi:hypothetical protein
MTSLLQGNPGQPISLNPSAEALSGTRRWDIHCWEFRSANPGGFAEEGTPEFLRAA